LEKAPSTRQLVVMAQPVQLLDPQLPMLVAAEAVTY
jgi:hypothetical protein